MDQNIGIGRLKVVELGFNTTRMLFTFGNLGAIAIDALADLSDGSKLALSVAVVILNISCVLSFDAELKIYAALSKDAGDENSAYAKNSRETPWGVFRVFCLVICIAAAVTQWMAINGQVSSDLLRKARLPLNLQALLCTGAPKRSKAAQKIVADGLLLKIRSHYRMLTRNIFKGEGVQDLGAGFVSLRGVNKFFDDVHAVANLDLDVHAGEFFSMLGPSGSGKTTVLRLIAGFESASTGTISIESQDVTELAPFDRPVNTVFQDYALFPHMSIQENVEYGLRTRKVPRPERAKQALEAIDSVKLSHLSQRLPHQLSGGQRQRIALARALVLRPKVLLLDEPLGALDKQLREEMQVELKRIQREAGITFIFVTHDQEEAMRMSDRIAVFNAGAIEQIGTPQQVYEKPESTFVARFLGVSNVFSDQVAQEIFGSPATVNIRPERIKLVAPSTKPKADERGVVGTIIESSYIGANTIFLIQTESGQRVIATRLNEELPDQVNRFVTGDRVGAVWKSDHSAVIPT